MKASSKQTPILRETIDLMQPRELAEAEHKIGILPDRLTALLHEQIEVHDSQLLIGKNKHIFFAPFTQSRTGGQIDEELWPDPSNEPINPNRKLSIFKG